MSKYAYKETITVIAKTYPECSQKYGCLVCTAGINEDGEWRRLYPIPWSLFFGESKLKFKKWDIVQVSIERDLYFGVGTTWRFRTWMVISLIYPPRELA